MTLAWPHLYEASVTVPGRLQQEIWPSNPVLDAPARYRRACSYESFIPDPLAELAINVDLTTAGLVSEAERGIRQLNSDAGLALAPLARLLLRTESIASSRIEGMQLGARELARAEARADTGGKAGPDAIEILANISAMELAIDRAAGASRITAQDIADIHRILLKHAPNASSAGRIRTGQNWIGGNDYNPCGAEFVPPPAAHVGPLLADLCDAINDDLLPPLVQAALVHAQFETIHPFDDGNGRTGRALIHVVLRRRGLAPSYVPPVSVVLAASRERYIRGLTRFRADGVVDWIEHFAAACDRAARLATAYLAEVRSLQEEWRDRVRSALHAPREDATAWRLIEILVAHPIITAPLAAALTGRSRARVYEAVDQLQRAGVLIPLSAGARNQSWEAVGLLDLIVGLESAEAPDDRS